MPQLVTAHLMIENKTAKTTYYHGTIQYVKKTTVKK